MATSLRIAHLHAMQAEREDPNFEYKRQHYAMNGEAWSWNNGRVEHVTEGGEGRAASLTSVVVGLAGVPAAPSTEELIPRIVHFVITDSSTRFVRCARRCHAPPCILWQRMGAISSQQSSHPLVFLCCVVVGGGSGGFWSLVWSWRMGMLPFVMQTHASARGACAVRR